MREERTFIVVLCAVGVIEGGGLGFVIEECCRRCGCELRLRRASRQDCWVGCHGSNINSYNILSSSKRGSMSYCLRLPIRKGDKWWQGHTRAFLKYVYFPAQALRQVRLVEDLEQFAHQAGRMFVNMNDVPWFQNQSVRILVICFIEFRLIRDIFTRQRSLDYKDDGIQKRQDYHVVERSSEHKSHRDKGKALSNSEESHGRKLQKDHHYDTHRDQKIKPDHRRYEKRSYSTDDKRDHGSHHTDRIVLGVEDVHSGIFNILFSAKGYNFNIGFNLGKTPTQVELYWGLQMAHCAFPKAQMK
ncbi:hypothetical protein Tco_0929156 [Tanacetum coccineum]